jgi:hypothetical protein
VNAVAADPPTFVLTIDQEWSSDFALEGLLAFARERGIVPTLFVTHRSAVAERAAARGEVELGIHPNFLPGSTHGDTVDAVLDHLLSLVPAPVASRSHAFVDGTPIALALAARGLRLDSNLCLQWQPGLVPLRHWAGLLRLPVFFADDVHARLGGDWRLAPLAPRFFAPGLKVLLAHPFLHALNLDTHPRYLALKPSLPGLDPDGAARLRHAGHGAATLLEALVDAVHARGLRFTTLARAARGEVS